MNKWFISGFIFASYIIYGLILNQSEVEVVTRDISIRNHPLFYDYKGALHVLTSESGGRSDAQNILDIAQLTNMNFVIFTDYNKLQSQPRLDGYFGHTLSIDGGALNYVDSRILLIPENNYPAFESSTDVQVTMADWLSQDRNSSTAPLLVLAHPKKPGFEWQGDLPSGLSGLEVLNLKSIWQDKWNHSKTSFIASLFLYPFNGRLALLRLYNEPNEEFRLWTQKATERPFVGLLGTQANARTGNFFGFDLAFPSYDLSFSLASNHLLLSSELTGDYRKDRSKIIEALKVGQLYFSLDFLGQTEGFAAYLKKGDSHFPIGTEMKFTAGLSIQVDLPTRPSVPYEINIFKDGEKIFSQSEPKINYLVQSPGIYRVQVRVKPNLKLPGSKRWYPWIYTNHFYLR